MTSKVTIPFKFIDPLCFFFYDLRRINIIHNITNLVYLIPFRDSNSFTLDFCLRTRPSCTFLS